MLFYCYGLKDSAKGQIVQVESSQTLIKGIAGTVQATEGLWHCQNKRKTRKAILFDAHGVSGGITGQGIVHAVSHVFCTQATSFPTPFLFLLPAPFSLPPDIPDKRRVLLRRPGGDDEGLNDGVPVRYELPTSKAARNPQLKAQSRTTKAPKFADKMFHFDAQMNFSFQICSRSLGNSLSPTPSPFFRGSVFTKYTMYRPDNHTNVQIIQRTIDR